MMHWRAEIHALMEGMALVCQHTELPIYVQSDSSEALSILSGDSLTRSVHGHLAMEIKFLMEGREYIPQKLTRSENRIADCLANYSRVLLFGFKELLPVLRSSCQLIIILLPGSRGRLQHRK